MHGSTYNANYIGPISLQPGPIMNGIEMLTYQVVCPGSLYSKFVHDTEKQ